MPNLSVIADSRKCVSCKACMTACIGKHSVKGDIAVPRLKVVQVDKQSSAPILCHQCIEPACVEACPTGALYIDEENKRVGVAMSMCIGCRCCAAACPYGAVDVVEEQLSTTIGGLVLETRNVGRVIKCDRCVDRDGVPACVEACETSALSIVSRDDKDHIVYIDKDKK